MNRFVIATLILITTNLTWASQKEASAHENVVKVTIGDSGFKPAKIQAKAGEDLVLMITRTTEKTCVTELKNVNGKGETELPLNKEVRFNVGHLKKASEITLLCGMNMKAGVVTVL